MIEIILHTNTIKKSLNIVTYALTIKTTDKVGLEKHGRNDFTVKISGNLSIEDINFLQSLT